MKVKFSRTTSTNLATVPLINGQLTFVQDTGENYIDHGEEPNTVRVKLSDILFIIDLTERDSIATPLLKKLYFIMSENQLHRYDGSDWQIVGGAGGGGVVDVIMHSVFTGTDESLVDQDGIANLNPLRDRVEEVYDEAMYNSVFEWDVTSKTFPANTTRDRRWHIKVTGQIQTPSTYSRYYYATLQDAVLDVLGTPNIAKAVAHRVINGTHAYFEYLTNGSVTSTVDLTDSVTGLVLNPDFRPVANDPVNDLWFYGSNQAQGIPQDGVILDFVDVNVTTLANLSGLTDNVLDTTAQQLIPAINEVNAKTGKVIAVSKPDSVSAQEYSASNHGVLVYVSTESSLSGSS